MISAFAFFGLAIVLLIAVGWFVAAERGRFAGILDRRLAEFEKQAEAEIRDVLITPPDVVGPLLAQADIELSREKLVTAAGVYLVAAFLALLWQGPVLALIIVLVVPASAMAWLRHRARSRVDQLVEGLPHYVDGIRQLLGIGASLTQAVLRALNEAPPPVRRFLDPVARRIELGTSVDDAMDQLAMRIRVPEVSMLAAAIRTQMRFGGSVTVVLANLAQLLRDRIRVKRDLKAATAEARVSAKVLIGMPMISMVVLVLANPEYPRFFLTDPRGQNMAMIAIVLQVMGIFILRRQMDLKF
jgi:tight adherence protein B